MLQLDYQLAHAAAWDAGNRSARSGGRTRWNEDDYAEACEEFARLMPLPAEAYEERRSQ